MGKSVHKALSSLGNEEGRTTGGIQCEEDAPWWEVKVLGRQLARTIQRLIMKPNRWPGNSTQKCTQQFASVRKTVVYKREKL